MSLVKMRIEIAEIGLIPPFRHLCRVVWRGGHFCGGIRIGRWGCRRGISKEERFFNHLTKREHLALMLSLDGGDDCGNCRCHRACYQLLEGGVYSLRVSYEFFETGNCFKKLVCVCEPGGVVKTRRSICSCSCFPSSNIAEREIYWLGSSYAVDELLQDGLDAGSLLIACVMLEFADGMDKAFGFYWKGNESHHLKNVEGKRERKKKRKKIVYRISGLWFRAFFFRARRERQCYQFVMGDNLVDGRIDNLLKGGHCFV